MMYLKYLQLMLLNIFKIKKIDHKMVLLWKVSQGKSTIIDWEKSKKIAKNPVQIANYDVKCRYKYSAKSKFDCRRMPHAYLKIAWIGKNLEKKKKQLCLVFFRLVTIISMIIKINTVCFLHCIYFIKDLFYVT